MNASVVVMEPAEFDSWIQQQNAAASQDPAARGQNIARTAGCLGCHSVDGKAGVGPSWQGLSGAERTLVDGSTVSVDDVYLVESITDPNKHVVQGFPPGVMPQTYEESLSSQEINDIVAYIKTLK
jgi:cytochrome c oxidase subunit 2